MGASLPTPPDVAAYLERALWAERQGYDGVWLADIGTVDVLTLAAALAVKTEALRIGLAVVPAYTRTPAVFASTAMTLSHLAPGRVIMGLGSSSHTMIEGWHGMAFEKPLTRVKETTLLLRKMLAGQREQFEGETLRSSGYTLRPPAMGEVPIYLAALRPKMLEMAGEFGDGIVLNSYPLEALPRMLEHVAVGAERAGKQLADLEIVCRHHVIVTGDEAAGRDLFRQYFAPYFATPVYNKFLAWCGYEGAAAEIAVGWREKDRGKTAAALDDALVDRLGVIGPPEKCREIIAEHIRLGITTPVINPIGQDPAIIQASYEAFTPAEFPV